MRIGYRTLCAVTALLIASACGRSDDDINVCDDNGNCRTYASPVEFNRVIAAENARQRRLAEGLPFDYHDLLLALLSEYVKESAFANATNQYFLSIFGSDIDATLTARLHESGIEVLPSSAWTANDAQLETGRHVIHIRVAVSFIKQVAPSTFAVGIGYYCGGLCAAGQTYTLRRSGERWLIVDRQTHWIA